MANNQIHIGIFLNLTMRKDIISTVVAYISALSIRRIQSKFGIVGA